MISGIAPARRLVTIAAWAACATGCARHAAPSAELSQSVAADPSQPPDWMRGTWTREWIQRSTGRSSAFDVHYLQTPSLFGDVRFPVERPSYATASSFADLSDTQLRALAKQRGFTGRTLLTGMSSTWQHDIDFQPSDGDADVGRIERRGNDRMYEYALDSSYVESWRRTNDGDGLFLAIRVEAAGRPQQILLVAGDDFMYVRNRDTDMPAAQSIDSLISTTHADRAQIIAWLNCEFSIGRVRGGPVPWEIRRSTLPWREGRHLEFVDDVRVAEGSSSPTARVATGSRWSVPVNTLSRAQLTRLFPAARHRD